MEFPTVRDECDVAALAVMHGTLEEISSLRKNPATGLRPFDDPSCLKYADEQTVLATAAMLRALEQFPEHYSFRDWGVVAAPRWPGRIGAANAIGRYQTEGARKVSPMLIPNLCLHAMSGTISLAFGMYGPNFGVGGGLDNVTDGLLAGLILQLEHRLPGTWVLLSEWDVEPMGHPADLTPEATAMALALVPPGSGPALTRLRLQPCSRPARRGHARLAQLHQFLTQPHADSEWSHALDWGLEMVLTKSAAKGRNAA